jgi:hypothetical protein
LCNIPNSKNLLRTYVSSTDPTRCTVQVSAAGNGPVQFEQVQFISPFADGSQAFTTNRQTSRTFDVEPDKFLQECRGLSDLAELKRRHEEFARQFQARGPVFTDTAHYLDEVQLRYDKELSHQVRRNLLRFDPARNEFRVTLKWALRLQQYMFNPFADKLTPLKVAATFMIAGLPVIAGLWYTQSARLSSSSIHLPGDAGWISNLTLAYIVAGIGAGLVFQHKSFIWAFLLAFIPTLLFPSATGHAIGMSLLMGWVADLTYRLYGRRRRLV